MHEGRMAVRTGRAVARPVRVARPRAPRVLLAAVALIVALSQVNIAYALPWAEKDGYPLGEILMSQDVGANRGTVVYGAANEFFATLCLIGRKSDYLQLSPDQLSELSGEGTGGAFWELSQRWNNYESDGMPDTWPIGISAAMQAEGLISDPAYIWYADYSYYESDSLYNRALDDYMTIYNGGHLGGGDSNLDGYVLCTPVDASSFDVALGSNSSYPVYDSLEFNHSVSVSRTEFFEKFDKNLYITSASYDFLRSSSPDGTFYLYCSGWNGSTSRYVNVQGIVPSESGGTWTYTPNYNGQTYGSVKNSLQTFTIRQDSYSPLQSRLLLHDGVISLVCTSDLAYKNTRKSSSEYYYYNYLWTADGSGGGGGGGGGGGTWPEPDPPTPPNPPEVPGPGTNDDPGIELPDPYMPIVDPVTDPDPITDPYVVVAAPDSTDIIEWLRAILRAINNLGDKLNAESTELQNALNKVFFTNLSRLLKNLKGEFIQDYTSWLNKELQWLNSEIHDYFVDMQSYLYRLFDWLADQMNFELNLETDPYDDTSLLNWLRRIYNKLGADSGPNTRPVDPSTDEDGFLDWLRRMIQNFILDLGAAASDVVSDLGDLLSRLFAKFPFSVPWDLLAILGILDAPTMVPRLTFDIPLTLGTSTFTWHVDVDMEPWSAYMEAVRTIMLVSFISWLIWLTPQVLRDLDPGDFL